MIANENQETSTGRGAIIRIPPRMRLAPAEHERLWKGLERFVDTGDKLEEYAALGKGWPSFWPADLRVEQKQPLAWNDICHDLFLVFRDTLRLFWVGHPIVVEGGDLGFLLGIGRDFNDLARGEKVLLPGTGEVWRSSVLLLRALN